MSSRENVQYLHTFHFHFLKDKCLYKNEQQWLSNSYRVDKNKQSQSKLQIKEARVIYPAKLVHH